MFSVPNNLLEQRLNETLSQPEESIVSILLKLSLLRTADKNKDMLIYTEIYKLLGVEKFTQLISLVNGETLNFPTKEEFKDTLVTVLCYYYRNIENKSWKEIKSLIGDPNLNTVKYGIRATTFGAYLKESAHLIDTNELKKVAPK